MIYREQKILLKNGKKAVIRTPGPEDAKEMIYYKTKMSEETEFVGRYPEEITETEEEEIKTLKIGMESKNSIQISAFVEGKLVANASIFPISERMKISHRAEFGIAVLEKYWGLGIGKVLTATCLEMAEKMGFAQVELSLLSSNKIGFLLYQKFGFKIWGELEKGFHMKDGRWETELFMVKYL